MPLRIAQVVYTLAQFPTVTSVQFKVDGQGVTVLGGVPVQSPQTTGMYDGYLPAITVQNPAIGEQVSSPVTVSGTADVFEAVVSAHPGLSRKPDHQDVQHGELWHGLPRRLLDPGLVHRDTGRAWHDRGVRKLAEERAAGQRAADPGDAGPISYLVR